MINRLGGLGGNLGIYDCNPYSEPAVYPTLPTSFDARSKWGDCISPIRNQGGCGSCWAFASTSVLTDRFCIASNNTIKRLLSPQDLVDCSKTCQSGLLNSNNCNNGCNGGYLDNAWKYFQQTGTVGDSCLQYTAANGQCTNQCTDGSSYSSQVKFTTSQCYTFKSVQAMQYDIYTNGPIEAGFMVYQDFEQYKSGVYIYDGSSKSVGGHAIRIMGWGTEGGVDYWLCANQWGSNWGEQGLFKIRRGTNECSIEDNAVAGMPITKGITDYEPYPTTSMAISLGASFLFAAACALMNL
eukprot:TRINITY_DN435_c0_g1_i2.p1 TRINITY_DN435_c0_g1~~TRINITY_DN435_c0_g1_i2.p1  ORF type:complete len:296 (-),score=57.44 TRINITY_DN435_c0_g1_i2:45-932(-)